MKAKIIDFNREKVANGRGLKQVFIIFVVIFNYIVIASAFRKCLKSSLC